MHDGQRYFLAYAVLAIEPFVLLPLLLGFMSAGVLGALGAVEALVVVLCGVTQLGVKFAYLQHVADVGLESRGSGWWRANNRDKPLGYWHSELKRLLLPVLLPVFVQYDLIPLCPNLGPDRITWNDRPSTSIGASQ
jgi:hypothetical protein